MSNDKSNEEIVTTKSIGKWISLLHRQFQIYLNNELKPYHINSSEYIFILNLYIDRDVNQKYLSDTIVVDEALTARVVKNLESKGFINRKRSDLDKRAYDIRLTEAGHKLKPIILKKLNNWTANLSRGMSEAKVDEIIETLKIMSTYALTLTKGDLNESKDE